MPVVESLPSSRRPSVLGDGDASGPLVVPLPALQRDSLALAGGKGANLGELIRAGFPVPPGFCVTTTAYALAAAQADLQASLEALASVAVDDRERQATLATTIRRRMVATPVPEAIVAAIRAALAALGPAVPVAVRSSATAEDLPFASFAGQQDSYLNVVGAEPVIDAVRRCWASLWTERAVAYRAVNGIDPRNVRLAVVVQRLVDAAVAGVMFTADPLTGRRRRVAIDASPGLGEAVVSGAVTPDHFVVDSRSGAVLEQRPGDARLAIVATPGGGTHRVEREGGAAGVCLSGDQLRELAGLGARVEAHFGSPQDVEFALDRQGILWLTQARPITTLFPLPAEAPVDDGDLRVYFNFNVAQGVLRPFTPAGVQAMRLITSSVAAMLGAAPADPLAGPPAVREAAGRLFLDVTAMLGSPIGRRLAAALLERGEARSAPLLQALLTDPRLAPRPVSWRRLLPTILRFLAATRMPLRVLQAVAAPGAARRAAWRLRDALVADATLPPEASGAARLDLAEQLLFTWPARIMPRVVPLLIVGLGSLGLAWRLLGDLATPDDRDTVTRALPHNPTTEMDLALWVLARRLRDDAPAGDALRHQPAGQLAAGYRQGRLPPVLQQGLAAFLDRYGHRAVAEIDLGLPRWTEDPAHLLGALANYLALDEAAAAPDARFRRATAQAEAAAGELVRRAARCGRLRGVAVRALLHRGLALAGTRELPKFLVVLLLNRARTVLAPVGLELARAGRLDAPDDLWFLTFPEMRGALRPEGPDLRALVRERRARYEDELRRRHLPRFLLSDGTEPQAPATGPASAAGDSVLRGSPASAGRVVGRARVILDPVGARLGPGEILVAPSTDPGWTPLFLTAGGLVMEMGGAMSHGAVVAREYGIPAVVGLAGATERIRDGAIVEVDGATGTVTPLGQGET